VGRQRNDGCGSSQANQGDEADINMGSVVAVDVGQKRQRADESLRSRSSSPIRRVEGGGQEVATDAAAQAAEEEAAMLAQAELVAAEPESAAAELAASTTVLYVVSRVKGQFTKEDYMSEISAAVDFPVALFNAVGREEGGKTVFYLHVPDSQVDAFLAKDFRLIKVMREEDAMIEAG